MNNSERSNSLMWGSLLAFILLILGSVNAQGEAKLEASVNHNIAQMGQEIEFTLTLRDESAKGQPSFEVLEDDFHILSGASRRSSKNFINGSFSSSTSWSIVISPKKEGSLVIPPISYAGLKTEPIILIVGKAPEGSEPDVFFETQLSTNEVYVQALLQLDLKLYIKKSNLSNTQLDPLTSADAKIIQVGKDRQSEVLKNGIGYFLVERSFFIFPEKSGTLTIPAIKFQGVITEGSRFSNYGKRRRINASSEQKTIKVLGIPDSFPKNATWLPAKNLRLKEQFNPGKTANMGDPITRTIITEAQGLNASALPPIILESSSNLKVYPDQGTSDEKIHLQGLTSTRQDSFALIANQVGELTLSEVSIPWWDTQSNTLRYAKIESQNLIINAGNETTQLNSNQNNNATDTEQKIDLALEKNQTSNETKSSNRSLSIFYTLLLSSVFSIIWLATVFYFLRKLNRLKQSVADSEPLKNDNSIQHINLKKSKQAIKTACSNKNNQELRHTLIEWAKNQFPQENIQGLNHVQRLLPDTAFSKQLRDIDSSIYSNTDNSKNGENIAFDDFFKDFENISKDIEKKQKTMKKNNGSGKGTALNELYSSH